MDNNLTFDELRDALIMLFPAGTDQEQIDTAMFIIRARILMKRLGITL